ncbi:hypothetical protein [Nocardioides rubriscoriae]|uniref:hypothetical protein n=1 Tax=Nocardioides rubriscoriae TaxID=642762 RepID=UPI0011DFE6BE|nr:hypothetical protein [Nocardioides rubriscoriae]
MATRDDSTDTWTDTWTRFLDDATPLPADPAAPVVRRSTPVVGDRAVRDDELPRLVGYAGDLRVVLTGGAGQVAGPAAYCRRHGLELSALDVTLRDLDDPAGNARRVVAAVDAAVAGGDLLEDTVVHVRVATLGDPTPSWLAAADVLAEAEMVLALPLGLPPGGDLDAWVDAALDRELAMSLVGGTPAQAVAALATAARLWGDPGDLARGRRWVRSWLTPEVEAALDHLAGLTP